MKKFAVVAFVAGFTLQGCVTVNGELMDSTKANARIAELEASGLKCVGDASSAGFGYSYVCQEEKQKANQPEDVPTDPAIGGTIGVAVGAVTGAVIIAGTGTGSGS
jgi:hypothetical protein